MSGKAGMSPADGLVLKAFAVLLLGMVLLLHGCSRFLLGGGIVIGAEVAEGTVVEVHRYQKEHRVGRGLASFMDVHVEYPLGDRKVRVQDSLGMSGENPEKGDRVKVYYDPKEPEKAVVGGSLPMTGIQYLLEWLVGIATCVGALMLIIRAGRLKRNEAKAIAKEGKETT